MEASGPKWANPILDNIWVNSLMLGGFQTIYKSEPILMVYSWNNWMNPTPLARGDLINIWHQWQMVMEPFN